MSFRIFVVPVNFLIRSVRFQTICNEVIIWYTPEAHTWFPTLTFIALITKVPWIEGWFIMALTLSLLIKQFFSWVWSSTVTAPWLSKICPLIISYWIVQIQIINFNSYINNYFLSKNPPLSSILLGGLISKKSIFHLAVNFLRKC